MWGTLRLRLIPTKKQPQLFLYLRMRFDTWLFSSLSLSFLDSFKIQFQIFRVLIVQDSPVCGCSHVVSSTRRHTEGWIGFNDIQDEGHFVWFDGSEPGTGFSLLCFRPRALACSASAPKSALPFSLSDIND